MAGRTSAQSHQNKPVDHSRRSESFLLRSLFTFSDPCPCLAPFQLNLANQSVLEGLNACLDHRGEIFIPELNRTFYINEQQTSEPLRIFACQNPYGQVSGRKGLPKSFLNRFTTIYFSPLERIDLKIICQQLYENVSEEIIEKMLTFNDHLQTAFKGQQWDFNLRDLLKWCQIINLNTEKKSRALDLVYVKRMRSKQDQQRIKDLYEQTTSWVIQPIEVDVRIDEKRLKVTHVELDGGSIE